MTRGMCACALAVVIVGVASAKVAASPAVALQQTGQQPAAPAPQTSAGAAGRQGTGPAVGRGAQMTEVLDILDGWESQQADKAVQISDAQYGTFMLRLKKLQLLRRTHQNQRQRLVNQLRQMANPPAAQDGTAGAPADDAAIEAQTKKLDEFDRTALQELQAAFASIDEVLNVRQRAKFRLLEERAEQEKLSILIRVMGAPGAVAQSPAQSAGTGRGSGVKIGG